MKKLLRVAILATLLVLIGCADRTESIDETVCREEVSDGEMIFTVHSEDGQIITATVETRTDVSDWEAEDIEHEKAWFTESRGAVGLEANCDLEGDTLVCYEVLEAEHMHGNTDLETFIEIMENAGSTCN